MAKKPITAAQRIDNLREMNRDLNLVIANTPMTEETRKRLMQKIADNTAEIRNLTDYGFIYDREQEVAAEAQERAADRKMRQQAMTAQRARREAKEAEEARLSAQLGRVQIPYLGQVASDEILRAYAQHLVENTERSDGSVFSNHTDSQGREFSISTESGGGVIVSDGHERGGL